MTSTHAPTCTRWASCSTACCTGKLPFKGDTAFAIVQSQVHDTPTPVSTVRPDLPPWVEEVISRSLAKAPADRFQSAAEFHEGFARCLAGSRCHPCTSRGAMEAGMTPPRPTPTGSFRMPTPSATFPDDGRAPDDGVEHDRAGARDESGRHFVRDRSDRLTPALGQATGRMTGATPQPEPRTASGRRAAP